MMGDHEGHQGRTTYATIGGCYYAARLAVSESLLRLGRQAAVVVLREVHPGEILPLGVWNVREHVRAALQEPAQRLASMPELSALLRSTFAIPLDRWLRQSAVLHEIRTQRRLDQWVGSAQLSGRTARRTDRRRRPRGRWATRTTGTEGN